MVVQMYSLRPIFLLAGLCLVIGCQPITIRSITTEDCPAVVEVAPVAECEQQPPKVYSASSWLIQRGFYCGAGASAQDKKVNIGRTQGVTESQRAKLAQLMALSCAPAVVKRHATNEPLAADNTTAPVATAQSLNLFLQQLVSESGWSADFQALFGLLAEQASQQHQLALESQTVRLEMQQKIDALMQLERDISNRDVK